MLKLELRDGPRAEFLTLAQDFRCINMKGQEMCQSGAQFGEFVLKPWVFRDFSA